MTKTLSHQEARHFYDRLAARLDSQSFYEDIAIQRLTEVGGFGSAESVFEFGCGTGRLALDLFENHLGEAARYRAHELSPKMVALARERLEPLGERARVILTTGRVPENEISESYDRFVSTYVLDLLSEAQIRDLLFEAWRMLWPGGLLCVASLCPGATPISRTVMSAWSRIAARRPALVGGCRPLDLVSFLDAEPWSVLYCETVSRFGVASEILIAERRAAA